MEIMVDTTFLIDYYRKTDKDNADILGYLVMYDKVYISSVSEFEVMAGTTLTQIDHWHAFLNFFQVIEFESRSARTAAVIIKELKKARKSIEKADLFIAATAVTHGLLFDTANRKHFEHIASLRLLQHLE